MKFNPAYAIVLTALFIASWPDGTETREPATDIRSCFDAGDAAMAGRAVPQAYWGKRATGFRCIPTDPISAGFKPGWDCISGFNCPDDRGQK